MTTTKGPVTEDELQQLRDMHAAGRSLSSIATELGRSKGTLGKHAARLGLSWTTGRTEAATVAKTASNREKRATLETRFLDEAALLLDQLHEPHLVYNFGGRDNDYNERLLDAPDVGAKGTLIRAAGIAVDKATRLAEVDAGANSAGEAKGILGRLGDALLEAYHADRETHPDEYAEGPETLDDGEGPATGE